MRYSANLRRLVETTGADENFDKTMNRRLPQPVAVPAPRMSYPLLRLRDDCLDLENALVSRFHLRPTAQDRAKGGAICLIFHWK